jgi:hypothetical protein
VSRPDGLRAQEPQSPRISAPTTSAHERPMSLARRDTSPDAGSPAIRSWVPWGGTRRRPSSGRRPPRPPHVSGNGRLTHRDSQLLELSVDSRGAPERVYRGHLANQRADVGWHPRPTRAMSTLPRPEQAKAAPMPGEYRRRLNDVERRVPAMPSLRQPRPQHTINGREAKPSSLHRHSGLVRLEFPILSRNRGVRGCVAPDV